MALLWAGGILWLAYDTASSQPQGDANSAQAQRTDATGSPVTSDDEARLAEALNSF